MRTTCKTVSLAAGLLGVASVLGAQAIFIGLRGSGTFPTGSFSQTQTTTTSNSAVIDGAKSGFGYGLDAGLSVGPIGIYAAFDHVQFDCQTATCQSDGKYTLYGVTGGVKLSPFSGMIRPFVKGGVTFSDLQGGYGGQSSNALSTDKAPGYEVGVGADVSFLGILSFVPQVRYIGQNLKAHIPGVSAPSATGSAVNYFTCDLGMAVHTPWGK
jgi:hypothetical protein